MSVANQLRRHDVARLSSRFEQWDPYERALFKRVRTDPQFSAIQRDRPLTTKKPRRGTVADHVDQSP